MKFLRLLGNALLCGLYASFLLALLVLDLNINHILRPLDLPRLAASLMASYGLLVAFLCLLAAAVGRFFAGRSIDVPFPSPRFLTLGFTLLTLAFLVVFRENTAHFSSFFVPAARSAILGQLVAWFVVGAAGLIVLYKSSRWGGRAFAGFFVLAGLAYLAAAGLRGQFPAPGKSSRLSRIEPRAVAQRTTVLELAGLSFDVLFPLISQGKLPNFAYLMENGAWAHLAGFTPSDPFVLRATAATGKRPGKHRQISEVRYGIPGFSGRVEVVPRFILFRQLKRLGLLRIAPNDDRPEAKGLWEIYEMFGASVRRFGPEPKGFAVPAAKPETGRLFEATFETMKDETSPTAIRLRTAFLRDAATEDLALRTKAETQPQLFGMTLVGLDRVQPYFYKFSFPQHFGDLRPEEIQKFGPVIERYCQFYDRILSKILASLKEDELLCVYSPYGVEPLPFWKRLVEWLLGNAEVSAYHERGPEGAVFFYGNKGIVRGRNVDPFQLTDIAPTLLYYAGLPVGHYMDGLVRTAVFTTEFKDQNPVQTIMSYEDVDVEKR
ncbi:MAG: hypothetical protein FJY82_04830 [Candidatus Aminicenantes bacterium]|nr:hypothetical protein [Candidatus Aminicenantes bacterium]